MLKNEFESCYRQGDYEAIAAYKVDNAVIMAAGFASRFAPLSEITPKALLKVKGEIMIERQIRQLRDAGIPDIYVVVGYKKEMFYYLEEKYDVHIIENPDYTTRNNHSSIYAVRQYLGNTYICSADNYFMENVFDAYVYEPYYSAVYMKGENNHSSIYAVRQYLGNTYICSADNYFMENVFDAYVYEPYYSAVYMKGETDEYCLSTNFNGKITHVKIGGANAWCMMGHSYWNREFSQKYVQLLEAAYPLPETRDMYWESLYMQNLDQLTLYIRKYPDGIIREFDNLDELCLFDTSYIPYRDSLKKEISSE